MQPTDPRQSPVSPPGQNGRPTSLTPQSSTVTPVMQDNLTEPSLSNQVSAAAMKTRGSIIARGVSSFGMHDGYLQLINGVISFTNDAGKVIFSFPLARIDNFYFLKTFADKGFYLKYGSKNYTVYFATREEWRHKSNSLVFGMLKGFAKIVPGRRAGSQYVATVSDATSRLESDLSETDASHTLEIQTWKAILGPYDKAENAMYGRKMLKRKELLGLLLITPIFLLLLIIVIAIIGLMQGSN